jgi:ribosomal-protein-alanine N-acetyltransferase
MRLLAYPNSNIGLAHLRAQDEAAFLTLAQGSAPFHHPWVQPPLTSDEFNALVERSTDPGFKALAIWQLQPRVLIGMIHFSQIFMGYFQSAYSSYWIGSGHAGKGWMTTAMRLALHYGFDDLGLHRIEANIQPQNLNSIALVRRVGFVKEGFSEKYLQILGEWKDHERWALHREIWPEASIADPAKPVWSLA